MSLTPEPPEEQAPPPQPRRQRPPGREGRPPPGQPPVDLLTERQREERRLRSKGDISLKVIALAAFVVGVFLHGCVAVSILGDDGGESTAVDEPEPTQTIVEATATVPAEAVATPTPEPDRTDCDEIRGTQYRSVTEREFFLENCVNQAPPAPADPEPTATQPPG